MNKLQKLICFLENKMPEKILKLFLKLRIKGSHECLHCPISNYLKKYTGLRGIKTTEHYIVDYSTKNMQLYRTGNGITKFIQKYDMVENNIYNTQLEQGV